VFGPNETGRLCPARLPPIPAGASGGRRCSFAISAGVAVKSPHRRRPAMPLAGRGSGRCVFTAAGSATIAVTQQHTQAALGSRKLSLLTTPRSGLPSL